MLCIRGLPLEAQAWAAGPLEGQSSRLKALCSSSTAQLLIFIPAVPRGAVVWWIVMTPE